MWISEDLIGSETTICNLRFLAGLKSQQHCKVHHRDGSPRTILRAVILLTEGADQTCYLLETPCQPILALSPQSLASGTASLTQWFKRLPRGRQIWGSIPICGESFRHTSDLKLGTPVATLSCSRHYRSSAGTGWSGGSMQ